MTEDEAVKLYQDIHGNDEFLVDGIHEEHGEYTLEVWDRVTHGSVTFSDPAEWPRLKNEMLAHRLRLQGRPTVD
jgi:hypothetical protein